MATTPRVLPSVFNYVDEDSDDDGDDDDDAEDNDDNEYRSKDKSDDDYIILPAPHGVRRPSIFVKIYQWWKGS